MPNTHHKPESQDKQSDEWKEETDWHRCVLWRCENVSGFLVKGKQVYLEGRLQTRDYLDRDGVKRYTTEIVIDDLILLGGGQGTAAAPAAAAAPDAGGPAPTDDEVPF